MRTTGVSVVAGLVLQGCSWLPTIDFTAPQDKACPPAASASANLLSTSVDKPKKDLLSAIDASAQSADATQAARLIVDSFTGSTSDTALGAMWRSTVSTATAQPPMSVKVLRTEMQLISNISKSGRWGEVSAVLRAQSGGRDLAADASRIADFIDAYITAYFRSGHVFSVKLDQSALQGKLETALLHGLHVPSTGLTSDQKKALDDGLKNLTDQLCKSKSQNNNQTDCPLIDEDDQSVHYVSRAGHEYGFPSVSATISPGVAKPVTLSKIDEIGIIGDLTRIFIEAASDAQTLTVGFSKTSTACTAKSQATTSGSFSNVVCFDSTDKDQVAAFNKVYEYADTAEGFTAAVIAELIRGLNIASLNNEALAKLVTSSISIGVRKKTEEVAWNALMCPSAPKAAQPVLNLTRRTMQMSN